MTNATAVLLGDSFLRRVQGCKVLPAPEPDWPPGGVPSKRVESVEERVGSGSVLHSSRTDHCAADAARLPWSRSLVVSRFVARFGIPLRPLRSSHCYPEKFRFLGNILSLRLLAVSECLATYLGFLCLGLTGSVLFIRIRVYPCPSVVESFGCGSAALSLCSKVFPFAVLAFGLQPLAFLL
jgi:hypothetical protein